MSVTTDSIRIAADDAHRLAVQILASIDVPADIAQTVASHLVEADQVGHASHGMARLPSYVRYVRDGIVRPCARPRELPTDRMGSMRVSAEWGFSHAAAYRATDLLTTTALRHGTAVASVIRCTHVGRLGAYVERAAASGCVAIATVGGIRGPGVAVPFGGRQPLFGPNPLAAAFPTTERPVVMDFSTTEVALGKVMLAQQAGEKLASPGLVEADGRPTDDPAALSRGGALRTFGGHKGFALAMMADLLGSVLTHADDYRDDGAGGPSFAGAGMLLIGIAADAFGSLNKVTARAQQLREAVHQIPPADGLDAVLAPGDPEEHHRCQDGAFVTMPEVTWSDLQALLTSLAGDGGPA